MSVFFLQIPICVTCQNGNPSFSLPHPPSFLPPNHPPAEQIIVTPRTVVLRTYYSIIMGSPQYMVRHTNLVQNLGCLATTAFLDKTGLLSGPMPVPTKLLVFDEANSTEKSPEGTEGVYTGSYKPIFSADEQQRQSCARQRLTWSCLFFLPTPVFLQSAF